MLKRFALIAALAVAGCTDGEDFFSDNGTLSSSAAVSMSPEQRELRKQEQKYASVREQKYASIRAGTAVAGGIIGGLACVLADCSTEQTLGAAAIGAGAGYVGGSYLTRQDQSFQASQDSLNADIEAAKNATLRDKESVTAAQKTLEFHRYEIDRLNRALNAGEVTTATYRESYNLMQGDLKSTRNIIKGVRDEISDLSNAVQRYSSDGIGADGLIRELDKQRELLRLAEAIERSTVGVLNGVPSSVRDAS